MNSPFSLGGLFPITDHVIFYFTSTTHSDTQHDKIGCDGQLSPSAVYSMSTDVTKIRNNITAPKPDTKTPKKQQVEKNSETISDSAECN